MRLLLRMDPKPSVTWLIVTLRTQRCNTSAVWHFSIWRSKLYALNPVDARTDATMSYRRHGVGVSVTGVRVAATAIRTHDKDGTVLLSALRAMHQTFSIAISRNLDNVTSALLDERVRAAILALEPRYNNDTAVGKSARAFLNDLNNHR